MSVSQSVCVCVSYLFTVATDISDPSAIHRWKAVISGSNIGIVKTAAEGSTGSTRAKSGSNSAFFFQKINFSFVNFSFKLIRKCDVPKIN